MSALAHPKRPCFDCPWRTDVQPGQFPPEAFRRLAATAYDMDRALFTCHNTPEDRPAVCAGFLLRGAMHNLSVRLAARTGEIDPSAVRDGGAPLFPDYRSMAIANGVDPGDPVLSRCRSNDE